jgi:hypothetical protein
VNTKICQSVVGLLAAFLVQTALGESGSSSQPSTMPSTIEIINSEDTAVPFYIDCLAGAGWEEMTLPPQYHNSYFCQGNPPAKLQFKLNTSAGNGSPGGTVTYGLEWGARYQIAFDPGKRIFDIKRVER